MKLSQKLLRGGQKLGGKVVTPHKLSQKVIPPSAYRFDFPPELESLKEELRSPLEKHVIHKH